MRSWTDESEGDQVATPPNPAEDTPVSTPEVTPAAGDPTGQVSGLDESAGEAVA